MTFAKDTEVPVDRTKAEIEKTLARYGADQFMSGWDSERAILAFRANGRQVRFILPLPKRSDPAFTEYDLGSKRYLRAENVSAKMWEQACRQRWRALALVVKAKLEAVEIGISTFDDEFLANLILPDGGTFGDWARPQLHQAYTTGLMPGSLPMLTDGQRAS